MDWYILDGHEPIRVHSVITWGEWMQTADRHVADDADEESGWRISTVFLGLDHRFHGEGPPILFETLVFAPKDAPRALREFDGRMIRYCTWQEAEQGHRDTCHLLRTALALARDTATARKRSTRTK